MNENIDKLTHETFKKINDKVNEKKVWYDSNLITENEFYCTNCLDDRKMKVINVKMREKINSNVYDTLLVLYYLRQILFTFLKYPHFLMIKVIINH